MSKKHFIAIAATIRIQLDNARGVENANISTVEVYTIIDTANRLCDVFADENPRFDRVRFLAACGINRHNA